MISLRSGIDIHHAVNWSALLPWQHLLVCQQWNWQERQFVTPADMLSILTPEYVNHNFITHQKILIMRKILVIEDTDTIRDNIAEILELSNYTVFTAADGKKGIEKAIAHHPDLIICDIMMPELDGYGVLHMVQKHPELRFTPF